MPTTVSSGATLAVHFDKAEGEWQGFPRAHPEPGIPVPSSGNPI